MLCCICKPLKLVNQSYKLGLQYIKARGSRDESGAKTFRLFRGKWKRNENMETETEICKTETKTEFFDESGNGNRTTFSGGTDAETEVSVFD
jgi:hypothetical protein